MKKILLALAVAAGTVPTVAVAQDTPAIQPYLGLLGGRESYDSERHIGGFPSGKGNTGGMVELVGGINVSGLGDVFVVGAEGSIAKGVRGTIDWQYAAFGRIGIKAGKDSMFFGKAGRRWVQFDVPNARTYHGLAWGAGVELSAQDVGASADSSLGRVKARFEAETFGNFRSIRPMAGIVVGF